jgi:hypothetical protein
MPSRPESPILASVMPALDAMDGSVPVFWIYIDIGGRWCVRREGGGTESIFASRAVCLAFVRSLGGNLPYRLFVETENGRMVQELHDGRTGISSRDRSSVQDEGRASSRHFDCGHQLASRSTPFRTSLLSNWFRRMRPSTTTHHPPHPSRDELTSRGTGPARPLAK